MAGCFPLIHQSVAFRVKVVIYRISGMIVGCHGDGLMNHLSAHSVRRGGAQPCMPPLRSPYTHHLKSCLVEERPLFYMHFMKWLITWGQGSILLLPIILEHHEVNLARRKSKIMAGYCRPPLSRKAVYCYAVIYIQRSSI